MLKCLLAQLQRIIKKKMKKTKLFLDQWVLFEIFETETRGLYEINAGVTSNGTEVNLSVEGYDLFFGSSNRMAEKYSDYGFETMNELKQAAVSCLYYTCLSSAYKLVGQHIVNLLKSGSIVPTVDAKNLIYGGRSTDDPDMFAIYMDIRVLIGKKNLN